MLRELPLEELRAARHLTQERLAQILGVKQSAISRMERRTDVYVSTLSSFIEAMGGKLEIRAVFPDGSVVINQFADAQVSKGGLTAKDIEGARAADDVAAQVPHLSEFGDGT